MPTHRPILVMQSSLSHAARMLSRTALHLNQLGLNLNLHAERPLFYVGVKNPFASEDECRSFMSGTPRNGATSRIPWSSHLALSLAQVARLKTHGFTVTESLQACGGIVLLNTSNVAWLCVSKNEHSCSLTTMKIIAVDIATPLIGAYDLACIVEARWRHCRIMT